jgi:hypothetical protein
MFLKGDAGCLQWIRACCGKTSLKPHGKYGVLIQTGSKCATSPPGLRGLKNVLFRHVLKCWGCLIFLKDEMNTVLP